MAMNGWPNSLDSTDPVGLLGVLLGSVFTRSTDESGNTVA